MDFWDHDHTTHGRIQLQHLPSELWCLIFDFSDNKEKSIFSLSSVSVGLKKAMRACWEIWETVDSNLFRVRPDMQSTIQFLTRFAHGSRIRSLILPTPELCLSQRRRIVYNPEHAMCEELARCVPYLKALTVSNNVVRHSSVNQVFVHWKYLETLTLKNCQISAKSLHELLTQCSSIYKLCLIEPKDLKEPPLFNRLQYLTFLPDAVSLRFFLNLLEVLPKLEYVTLSM